jgi:hypothetical protein
VRTLEIELDVPHAGQMKVLAEAKRFNVLQCGRRWGKTTFGLNRLIDTALRGHPAGWFAPTYKVLADAWREAVAILSPIEPQKNEQEKRLVLPTGGTIEFWSLDDPDAGRSRKYKRVFVDEAGIVRNLEQSWQQAIRPTLTDLIGDAWFGGTPKGQNFFHRLYARGQSGEEAWASWRMPTSSNPYIDRAEIEEARRDMPPAAFNQEYLGIPADDGGNPFGLDAIARCVGPLSTRPPVVFGVDLAKSQDWTVVVGLDDDGCSCVMERWQSDWKQTTRKVLDMVGSTPTLIDSTGVGDPIVEDLSRQSYNIEGFKFTQSSKQQIMEGLAASIQRGEIRFPGDGDHKWLRNELEVFEYQYTAHGVRYSAPQGMNDDAVCALALCDHKRKNRLPTVELMEMTYGTGR